MKYLKYEAAIRKDYQDNLGNLQRKPKKADRNHEKNQKWWYTKLSTDYYDIHVELDVDDGLQRQVEGNKWEFAENTKVSELHHRIKFECKIR